MGGGFDRAPAPGKPSTSVDRATSAAAPGKRTRTEQLAPPPRPEVHPAGWLIDGSDADAPVQGKALDPGFGDVVAAARAPAAPLQSLFGRERKVQRKEAKDDE